MRPVKMIPSHLSSASTIKSKLHRGPVTAPSTGGQTQIRSWPRSWFTHSGIGSSTGVNSVGGGLCLSTPLTVIGIVLCTLVLSVIYYVAIRRHDVQLSFKQLSEIEGHVVSAGNQTAYIVELPRRHGEELLLTALSADDWRKLSERRHIDFVMFLYDDIDVIPPPLEWLPDISQRFDIQLTPKGYGIVLFPCGCILPNILFIQTHTRFDGFECTMLPGLVIPEQSVMFLNVSTNGNRCARRDTVLSTKWYENYAWKLANARKEHEALRKKLMSQW